VPLRKILVEQGIIPTAASKFVDFRPAAPTWISLEDVETWYRKWGRGGEAEQIRAIIRRVSQPAQLLRVRNATMLAAVTQRLRAVQTLKEMQGWCQAAAPNNRRVDKRWSSGLFEKRAKLQSATDLFFLTSHDGPSTIVRLIDFVAERLFTERATPPPAPAAPTPDHVQGMMDTTTMFLGSSLAFSA